MGVGVSILSMESWVVVGTYVKECKVVVMAVSQSVKITECQVEYDVI